MQLGTLSCGNFGRGSPEEEGGIFDCTPPNLPLWGGTLTHNGSPPDGGARGGTVLLSSRTCCAICIHRHC